jgi:MioC protein
MPGLHSLIATTTGTAQSIAHAVQMECAHLVHTIEATQMEGLFIDVIDDRDSLYLICSST